VPRPVPGDPLTGSLPRTQLVVPQDIYGPVRQRRTKPRDEWPIRPDSMATTVRQMAPGRVAAVRTRFGVRTWLIRTVNTSREMHNRGRHFFTGMDRRGFCHSAWIDQVISVDSVVRALAEGRQLKALSPGPKVSAQ
jgi:hypothetical protein